MKQLIPIFLITILCISAYTDGDKSDFVAVYDADSVFQGNQRYIKERERAMQQLEASRKQTPNEKEADKRKQEVIQGNPKVQEEIKSKTKNSNAGPIVDPNFRQKQITKDSIFLYDSVPARNKRRVIKVAEDYRKTYGYKYIMTKQDFGAYKMTSNGSGSKSENATKPLINYSNQDSVATKY